MQKIERYDRFEDGVIACIPTILGYLGIGFAMGVVGKGVGLSLSLIHISEPTRPY